MSKPTNASGVEHDFTFVQTPASTLPDPDDFEDCGVTTTNVSLLRSWIYTPFGVGKPANDAIPQSPAIANAPLPADGSGSDSFSNITLISILLAVPYYCKWKVGGGLKTFIFFALIFDLPILAAWWLTISAISPRKNDKVKLPNKGVEHYLDFKKEEDKNKYRGQTKIPMETFHEKYFDGDVDFKGDALEILEYRHDWANFNFTVSLIKFFLFVFLPDTIMHSRAQDEEQVRDHYDRGDDFYGWFLGPRMIYTSGLISDVEEEETLEQLQDNKLAVVCEKIDLKRDETMLDIGCGWGTLARFASENYGAKVTGVTLARNQTAWGNAALRKVGITEEQSRIKCQDYRDIELPKGGFDKITCLEMSEHVGVRHFSGFLRQIYNMLDDDGVFFMQYAGLRKPWQYEDFHWGLFMTKYIFQGADASTPLGWTIDKLEGAGFEIKEVDTIGVHYSATLWRWYRNWLGNRDKVEAKYGKRWFRIWEYFLAYSTIASRQGSATCFQITMVKNINSTHRIEGVPTQYALQGGLKSARAKFDLDAWAAKNNVSDPAEYL